MYNILTKNKSYLTILKVFIGLGLLTYLIRKVDINATFTAINNVETQQLFYGLVFFGFALIADTLKFRSACQNRFKFIASLKLVLLGLLFNNFVPTNVGGDAYILMRIKKSGIKTETGLTYVMTNRFSGLLSLVILGGISIIAAQPSRYLILNVIAEIGFSARMPFLMPLFLLLAIIAWFLIRKYKKYIVALFLQYKYQMRYYLRFTLFRTVLFGLLLHLSRASAIIIISFAFGHRLPLTTILVILMLVGLISMLPISIGGLGVRESIFSYLLHIAGLPLEVALALTLLNLAVLWSKSFLGLLIFVFDSLT